jgi:GntR family transcriptional regulator/MocR family aminotransferase
MESNSMPRVWTTSPELLVALDRDSTVPLTRQLSAELKRAILSGTLRPGVQLPPTRALSADLRVARGVVVQAYEQLAAEGFLTARAGSGTAVAAIAQPTTSLVETLAANPATTSELDFKPGVPDLTAFPRTEWASALRRALTNVATTALRRSPGPP